MPQVFSPARVAALTERARADYIAQRPRSAALAAGSGHLLSGVPMHWMRDWGTPFPLYIDHAQGAQCVDVDGHVYTDFCLGDTGAMFGHSPAPVAAAIAERAARGYSCMLPGADANWVGAHLAERFGLPVWQIATTATDANRFVLRWARGLTGRPVVVVFDGCYHGTVDDTLVRQDADGRTVARSGLVGQVADLGQYTRVVPFNDLAALHAALAPGDVACVLTEPALTNIGMVLPAEGFLAGVRQLTRQHGALLVIDETHTISTGYAGYSGQIGLEPDMLVLGKPIAGGLPAAVYGMSAEVAARAEALLASKPDGHSGMGTTLSANLFTLAAMRANLEQVMTREAYALTTPRAARLADALRALFAHHRLPWCVTQIGARCEFQFCPTPPRTGAEAEAAMDHALERLIHLSLLNQGVLITPFHNMMLVCPDTPETAIAALVDGVEAVLEALRG